MAKSHRYKSIFISCIVITSYYIYATFRTGGSYSHGSNLNNDRPVAQPGIDGTLGKFTGIETDRKRRRINIQRKQKL